MEAHKENKDEMSKLRRIKSTSILDEDNEEAAWKTAGEQNKGYERLEGIEEGQAELLESLLERRVSIKREAEDNAAAKAQPPRKKPKHTSESKALFEEEPESEHVEAEDERKLAGNTLENRWHEDQCL